MAQGRPAAADVFEAALRKLNAGFSGPDSDGLYSVQTQRGAATVSLANITRIYE